MDMNSYSDVGFEQIPRTSTTQVPVTPGRLKRTSAFIVLLVPAIVLKSGADGSIASGTGQLKGNVQGMRGDGRRELTTISHTCKTTAVVNRTTWQEQGNVTRHVSVTLRVDAHKSKATSRLSRD